MSERHYSRDQTGTDIAAVPEDCRAPSRGRFLPTEAQRRSQQEEQKKKEEKKRTSAQSKSSSGNSVLQTLTETTNPLVVALISLRVVIQKLEPELTKELKKTRLLGVQGRDTKAVDMVKQISDDAAYLVVDLVSENWMTGVSSDSISEAYKPISDMVSRIAYKLRMAGQEQDGYTKYCKKDRKEMAIAVTKLQKTLHALIRLLLFVDLDSKRMSHRRQASELRAQGKDGDGYLKAAMEAWGKKFSLAIGLVEQGKRIEHLLIKAIEGWKVGGEDEPK